MRWRVVCGLSETIDTLAPQMALTNDDLPTLGRPTSVTNPERTRLPVYVRILVVRATKIRT